MTNRKLMDFSHIGCGCYGMCEEDVEADDQHHSSYDWTRRADLIPQNMQYFILELYQGLDFSCQDGIYIQIYAEVDEFMPRKDSSVRVYRDDEDGDIYGYVGVIGYKDQLTVLGCGVQ